MSFLGIYIVGRGLLVTIAVVYAQNERHEHSTGHKVLARRLCCKGLSLSQTSLVQFIIVNVMLGSLGQVLIY